MFKFCIVLIGLCVFCRAQRSNGATSQFLPPSWPLAVKNPYLNTWLTGRPSGGLLSKATPSFWPAWDDQTTWTCFVVVDGASYMIMGLALPPHTTSANQTAASFTATRSSFMFMAGPVAVNATFLSSVTPTDLVRQSMPITYFFLDIVSTDGAAHNIRVYSDIDAQWLHGNKVTIRDPNPEVRANASFISSKDFVGLQMQLESPQPFFEIAEHAQDVIGIIAMKSTPNIKFQVGMDAIVRTFGTNATGLQNTIDANYAAHNLNVPYDAFAISVDLGSITTTSDSIVWIVGMLRDPAINLTTASGANQLRSSYYWSNFSSIPDMISFALDDFEMARSSANIFDQMIQNTSLSQVTGYSDLLSLACRQLFGTLEITVSKSNDGTWNQSDVMIFSKDMGDVASTGTSGGTNLIDILYAGFPAFLYLNPKLGEFFLRPILESQVNNGTLIGQSYAPSNLGSQFPNVTSNTSPHNSGIEQSGNMLIMVLALLQKTGDILIAQNYYPLLKSWADYLVNQTLSAGFQTTSLSDGITSYNQTNLVLKGIIGISAMSSISSAINEVDDEAEYRTTAQQYIQIWLNGALSQDQSYLISSFGNEDSNGLIYNMYADRLLGLGLIPSNISSIQSKFYESLLSSNRTPFGIPLDSSNSSLSRLDWTMFAISSTLDDQGANAPTVLQPIISVLKNYAASTNFTPLAVVYNPETGVSYSGSNSFAVGALFAPLVMGNMSGVSPTPNSSENVPGQKSSMMRIVAITAGTIGVILFLGLGFLAWRRRSHRSRKEKDLAPKSPSLCGNNNETPGEPAPEVSDAAVQRLATARFERYVEDLLVEVQAIRSAAESRRSTFQENNNYDAPPSYFDSRERARIL
ncbi:hypothetical protein SCHPADRAFT_243465 [Schizopora paradoxa]|uniref:DUF1793-domain-containing protein n=1 Tax=Schizopora paradoxa TaxID=27342 RepID=A0A0H2S1X4_9AGAM|nr:hypothetical protein SCHPADRAFT_243465 [Schizopora paradoxa]